MKNYKLYILSFGLLLFSLNNIDAQCTSGDCINGIGIWEWQSGAKYTGQFQNGTRNGYGQYEFGNKDVYVGDWQNNERHGYGVYNYNDRSGYKSYSGEWVAGQRSGLGIMHYDDNSITPRFGIWKENNFLYKYENLGCLEGDCYEKYGIYVWNDGTRYEGNFKNGKRDGEGLYYYLGGAKYIGSQSKGNRHGWGTYYYPTGGKFVGEWVDELKHGKGIMYAGGAVHIKGIWQDNTFIKSEPKTLTKTDRKPPVINILSPSVIASRNGGIQIVVKEKEIYVEGTASDESGIERVRTNGSVSELTLVDKETHRFAGTVILSKGQNTFWIEATDKAGNIAKEEFRIIYTPTLASGRPATSPDRSKVISEKRTALVIGNANYMSVPALRNPKNDAIAIASKLKDFNFEVELLTDVSENQMIVAIRDYGEKLKKNGGVGLFYYAGHGLQLNGQNYLVPVNADIRKTEDIELETVDLKRVLNELEFAENRMNIVILDACRDNPYGFERGGMSTEGLSSTNAPSGTYIAYATAPGKAASDGKGENGLYTEMLLRALDQSNGIQIEDVFKRVREYVLIESEGLQTPWDNSSIIGEFYFKE